MNSSIADIRTDYRLKSLLEADVADDAMEQFSRWWSEAVISKIDEVNAMTLATASPDGIPHARIVLLKGFSAEGFTFFTNYNSSKGKEMAMNPHVSLVFFWKELERQVRIEGTAKKINEADSDTYFLSRPEGSRIGAWASPQSAVIQSRQVIEDNFTNLTEQYSGKKIPRPEHWGGYVVIPSELEFWQGRSSRLHDRIQYTNKNGQWVIERLAP